MALKVEFEEKFIIIDKDHIKKLNRYSPDLAKELISALYRFFSMYEIVFESIKENIYYICNQDEPYAQKVLDIISKGENKKRKTRV